MSEHDPKWREAVIAVDKVHKGEGVGDQVTVRFPASTDGGWFKAPKFEAGQQGYFVLQKWPPKPGAQPQPETSVPTQAGSAKGDGDIYTALHPLDFQPYSQQDRIRAAISSPAICAGGSKEK